MAEPAYPLAFLERDDGESWPAQGEWTYKDYLRLPDDGRRYEIIHGSLYVTPAPRWEHQFTVTRLGHYLTGFSLERGLGTVCVAPFDIRLPRRIGNPVQPDLIFFKKGTEPREGESNFKGIPSLVIEVLSPRTRRIDRGLKMEAYRAAGISEYWLVDPRALTVTVYQLDPKRQYVELSRGGDGDVVTSAVLPGLRLEVSKIFLPRR